MPPSVRPLTWPGFFWALPNTLLGLLAALASAPTRWQARDGMLVVQGQQGFARRFLTDRKFLALTLGRVVLTTQPLDHTTWEHEREHARQAERYGPFFLALYLILPRHARLPGEPARAGGGGGRRGVRRRPPGPGEPAAGLTASCSRAAALGARGRISPATSP